MKFEEILQEYRKNPKIQVRLSHWAAFVPINEIFQKSINGEILLSEKWQWREEPVNISLTIDKLKAALYEADSRLPCNDNEYVKFLFNVLKK